MGKLLLKIIGILLIVIILFGESREFHRAPNGTYVTVWRTFDNVCYITPYKYWGLIAPTDNYIETKNSTLGVDLVWKDNNTLLVAADEDIKIIDKVSRGISLVNYNLNQKENDTLYTYFDSAIHVKRYKEGVNRIALTIYRGN